MTQKQISSQVEIGLDQFIRLNRDLGFEVEEELKEAYRQILEGIVIRELAAQETNLSFPFQSHVC